MQHICIYDKVGLTAKQICEMDLWKIRKDLILDEHILNDESKVILELQMRKPDVFIMVMDYSKLCSSDGIKLLKKQLRGINIIFISYSDDYDDVRNYFTSGVFDYLVQPLDEERLKKSILRVYSEFGLDYVVNELQLKVSALIDHIFLGGGQEDYIISEILDQIDEDWKQDPISFQVISDKAMNHIYQILIERKSWLEKFLYRNDFTYRWGFSLKTKEKIKENWIKCFKEASEMVEKYKMIDDPLVYHIGKYVVVHVDEKLSLNDVAKGVFLNPSYVSHIFKKTTGMNFMDYLLEVKIDRAKVLLRDSSVRIYDVAATIGYNNPEYFSKKFKEKTGYAPIEFQKKVGGNK